MVQERIPNMPPATEEDEYSDDPARRKLYWLSTTEKRINSTLEGLRIQAITVPQVCQLMLRDGSHYESESLILLRRVSPENTERAASLMLEIGEIVHEKGFRFGAALLTPREHEAIGSSGYGGIFLETDPNVPVPLLQARLVTEGKMSPEEHQEHYTPEEIDKARRLHGKTRLDLATGRVTSEIDEAAANDSYYFLSPQRRTEVMAREQQILKEFSEITTTAVSRYEPARGLVPVLEQYMEGKVTSPQMREQYRALVHERDGLLDLSVEIFEAKKLAFGTGRWDHILTPQEIMLRVEATVDPKYLSRPYIPLDIQDGKASEEIVGLRQGEKTMVINTTILPFEMPFGFRLEELDADGNTLKSPTFLSREDGETPSEDDGFREYFGPQIKFPFARPTDWFYTQQ